MVKIEGEAERCKLSSKTPKFGRNRGKCIHFAKIGGMGGRGSKRLKKPLLLNCPPRHLHVVPLLYTESVVDDRVLAGICECPRIKKPKDGRWSSATQGDGVSRKTPGGRQWETTSLTILS